MDWLWKGVLLLGAYQLTKILVTAFNSKFLLFLYFMNSVYSFVNKISVGILFTFKQRSDYEFSKMGGCNWSYRWNWIRF